MWPSSGRGSCSGARARGGRTPRREARRAQIAQRQLARQGVANAELKGAALAQRAADLVLAGRSLSRIPQTVDIARRTRRVIRQNITWALAYNLSALPLAAAGVVTPLLAALGMAASSLLVTGNALRLARPGRKESIA